MPRPEATSEITRTAHSFASVTDLGAARDDVIDARREGGVRSEEKTEAPDFFRRAHAAGPLRGLAVIAALRRIRRGVDRRLPQRREHVAGRDAVDAHAVD